MTSTAVAVWDSSLLDLSAEYVDLEARFGLLVAWTIGLAELGVGWVADRNTWNWLAAVGAPYDSVSLQALLTDRGIAHVSGLDLYNLLVRIIEQGDSQAQSDAPEALGDIPAALAGEFDHSPCHLDLHRDEAINCFVLAGVASVFSDVPTLGLITCDYAWPQMEQAVAIGILDIEPDSIPTLIGTSVPSKVTFLSSINDLYRLDPDEALVTTSSDNDRLALAAVLAARRMQTDSGVPPIASREGFSMDTGFATSAREAGTLSNHSGQVQLVRSMAGVILDDHGDGEHRVRTGSGGNDPDLEWNGRHLLRRELSRGSGRRLHYWEGESGSVGYLFANVTIHDDLEIPRPHLG